MKGKLANKSVLEVWGCEAISKSNFDRAANLAFDLNCTVVGPTQCLNAAIDGGQVGFMETSYFGFGKPKWVAKGGWCVVTPSYARCSTNERKIIYHKWEEVVEGGAYRDASSFRHAISAGK